MGHRLNKMEAMKSRMAVAERSNACFQFFGKVYYDWGLNHVILLGILAAYSFLGAGTFMLFEGPAQDKRVAKYENLKRTQRNAFIDRTFSSIFNDSDKFLLYITKEQTYEIRRILNDALVRFETNLSASVDVGHAQKMDWDFWNSMLYSWTLITTIGYGHLYPTTDGGKIATMIYAIIGIPLMLVILNDLGKLLTKFMKYPWFLAKKWGRRLFQYCTRMSRDEIRAAEQRDKERLEVFDLPVVVAIAIVIGWIFLCSAIQMLWESEWDYLVAFYFFFISLSTIGLGDIAPKEPKYLLIMFWNIAIGLSLVSMCISLIQTKLEKTYHVGQDEKDEETVTEVPISDTGVVADALRKAYSVPLAVAMKDEQENDNDDTSRRPSIDSIQSAPEYISRKNRLSFGKSRKKPPRIISSSAEKIAVKVSKNKVTRKGTKNDEISKWENDEDLMKNEKPRKKEPHRDRDSQKKEEHTLNATIATRDKRSILSASTTSVKTDASRQNSSSGVPERPPRLKNKESSWSLDPTLFDDENSPLAVTVPTSRSFASIASRPAGVTSRSNFKTGDDNMQKLLPVRKAPSVPGKPLSKPQGLTKNKNQDPNLESKVCQLKKELSQYDNVDLMGPGDILDQVRHEENLPSPKKNSFPLRVGDSKT